MWPRLPKHKLSHLDILKDQNESRTRWLGGRFPELMELIESQKAGVRRSDPVHGSDFEKIGRSVLELREKRQGEFRVRREEGVVRGERKET
jgi:hypothetical protein